MPWTTIRSPRSSCWMKPPGVRWWIDPSSPSARRCHAGRSPAREPCTNGRHNGCRPAWPDSPRRPRCCHRPVRRPRNRRNCWRRGRTDDRTASRHRGPSTHGDAPNPRRPPRDCTRCCSTSPGVATAAAFPSATADRRGTWLPSTAAVQDCCFPRGESAPRPRRWVAVRSSSTTTTATHGNWLRMKARTNCRSIRSVSSSSKAPTTNGSASSAIW